jgi:bacterioferritin-associated ferredoxin
LNIQSHSCGHGTEEPDSVLSFNCPLRPWCARPFHVARLTVHRSAAASYFHTFLSGGMYGVTNKCAPCQDAAQALLTAAVEGDLAAVTRLLEQSSDSKNVNEFIDQVSSVAGSISPGVHNQKGAACIATAAVRHLQQQGTPLHLARQLVACKTKLAMTTGSQQAAAAVNMNRC